MVSKVWLARCNVQIQTYWSRCKGNAVPLLIPNLAVIMTSVIFDNDGNTRIVVVLKYRWLD